MPHWLITAAGCLACVGSKSNISGEGACWTFLGLLVLHLLLPTVTVKMLTVMHDEVIMREKDAY